MKFDRWLIAVIIISFIYILPYFIISIDPGREIFAINDTKILPTQDEYVYMSRVVKSGYDIRNAGDYNLKEYSKTFIDPHEKFQPFLLGMIFRVTHSVDWTYTLSIFIFMALTMYLIFRIFLILRLKERDAFFSMLVVYFTTNILPQLVVMAKKGFLKTFPFVVNAHFNYNLRFYNNLVGAFFLWFTMYFLVRMFVARDINYESWKDRFFYGIVLSIGAFYTYIFLTLFIPVLLVIVFLYLIYENGIKENQPLKFLFWVGGIIFLFGIPQIVANVLTIMGPSYSSIALRHASPGAYFHYYNLYATLKYILFGGLIYLFYKFIPMKYWKRRIMNLDKRLLVLSYFILISGVIIIDHNIITGSYFIQEHMESRILDPLVVFFFMYAFSKRYQLLKKAAFVFIVLFLISGFSYHYYTTYKEYKDITTPPELKALANYLNTIPGEKTILFLSIPENYYLSVYTKHFPYLPYASYTLESHENMMKRLGRAYGFFSAGNYLAWIMNRTKQNPMEKVTGRIQDDYWEHQYFVMYYWNTTWHPLGVRVFLNNIVPSSHIFDEDQRKILSYMNETPKFDYVLVGPFERRVGKIKFNLTKIYDNGRYQLYKR